jgi:hypothetical protein
MLTICQDSTRARINVTKVMISDDFRAVSYLAES